MTGRGGLGGIFVPLILLCFGLAALAYQLAEKPIKIPSPSPIGSSAGKIPELPEYARYKAPALSELNETVARPLFSEARRPPVAPLAVQPVEPEPKSKVTALNHTLIGIFTKAETKLALLHPKGRGPNLRLRVGDMVDGWTIIAITPEQVELEQAGETQILIPKPPVLKKPKPTKRKRPRRRLAPPARGGTGQRVPEKAARNSFGQYSPSWTILSGHRLGIVGMFSKSNSRSMRYREAIQEHFQNGNALGGGNARAPRQSGYSAQGLLETVRVENI